MITVSLRHRDDNNMGGTHVEPGHAQPADGEERVEHEEQHRGRDLRARRVDAPEDREEDHGDHLADGAEQHERSAADTIDEHDRN